MRRWVLISHMALGFSGALCFLAITAVVTWNIPRVNSMLAHADKASENVVNVTKVIADGSEQQAAQAVQIERDVRALSWKVDRSLGHVNKLVDTAADQVKHVGPLLDSMKKATDSIPGAVMEVADTAKQSTATLKSAQQVADDLHAKITDKRVDDLMSYVHDSGKHISSMTDSGAKMAADAQWKAHQWLHPDAKTKVKLGFWGSTWAGLEFIRNNVMPKIAVF